jgi:hypothetical protein
MRKERSSSYECHEYFILLLPSHHARCVSLGDCNEWNLFCAPPQSKDDDAEAGPMSVDARMESAVARNVGEL